MTITAQDLYNYTKCAHRVFLDANGDPAQRSEAGAFVHLLWEKGVQTERNYIAGLAAATLDDLSALGFDAACDATASLMREGRDLIYQGAFRSEDYAGRPDLLVKHAGGPSTLGDYYYEPVDIKAGHGWEQREGKRVRFKQSYAFQILFYREILRSIQGYLPNTAHIVNVEHEFEEFDPASFQDAFNAALADVERLVRGVPNSEPVLGSVCHLCHWYSHCRRWVEGTRDPSGLYFVGKVKFDLKRAGLKTIWDIARLDVDAFIGQGGKIPRMGPKALRRLKERAVVRLSGKPLVRPGYVLPTVNHEVFFDIEDDPTRDLVYLYGVVVRDSGRDLGYRYFFARRAEEEEAAARRFWDFLAGLDQAAIYVYSAKERSTLNRLMERYNLDRRVYDRYVAMEYDLYSDLIVNFSDWPTYSYGIKQIAPFVGFRWRDADPGGANSIAWYNDYLEHPERAELLQRILEYNEDDCRAMIAIKDYFHAASGTTA